MSIDGGLGDASADSAPADAARDAASADASSGDGAADSGDGGNGAVCSVMDTSYSKTCMVAADCGMVGRGCHCGTQPVIGVSKSVLAAATACEADAANKCALGCAVMTGAKAEDGKTDDKGTIVVVCESKLCRTVVQ